MIDGSEFLNFQLKHFVATQDLMASKKIAKLNFERYIARKRAVDAVAKKLVGYDNTPRGQGVKTKNTIVFIGTTVDSSPAIKGYVRTPKRAVIASMKRFADVFFVNEFRSTMLCSRCFQPSTTSQDTTQMEALSKMRYYVES